MTTIRMQRPVAFAFIFCVVATGLADDAPALAHAPTQGYPLLVPASMPTIMPQLVVVPHASVSSMATKLVLIATATPIAQPEVASVWRRQGFEPYWARDLSFVVVIKALCMMSNLFQQLSLFPAVLQIKKLKSVGDFDSLPMVSLFLTGIQWICYGLFACMETGNHKFMIIVYANLGSLSFGAYYTLNFHWNCDNTKSRQRMQFYLICGVVIFLAQATMIAARPLATALFFSGAVSAGMSIVVGASPLASLSQVFRTRSLASMPVEMVFVNILGSTLWIICGATIWDQWLMFTNGVQLAIGFGLLLVIVRIHPSTQKYLYVFGDLVIGHDEDAKEGSKSLLINASKIEADKAVNLDAEGNSAYGTIEQGRRLLKCGGTGSTGETGDVCMDSFI